MKLALGLGAALTAALLFNTGTARAQGFFEPRSQGSRISLQTEIWPTSEFTLGTMGIAAQLAVHENIMIDLDVPWAFGGGGGETYAVFGNPTFGAHFATKVTPDVAFFAGMTISVPTRFKTGDPGSFFFAFAAASSRAYADFYRYFPELLFFRIPIGLEAHFADYFYYRGELTPVIIGPVGEDIKDIGAQLILEHADEIEGRAPFGFGGGLRFQFTFALTDTLRFGSGDQAQLAMEPFVGYEPRGSGLFARLGLLMALDTPAGFAFDAGKLRTIRIHIGGKF